MGENKDEKMTEKTDGKGKEKKAKAKGTGRGLGKRDIGLLAALIAIILAAFGVCGFTRNYSYYNGAVCDVFESAPSEEAYIPLASDMVLEQEFQTDVKLLKGITLRFDFDTPPSSGGNVIASLHRADDGELIGAVEINTVKFVSGEYVKFVFPNVVENQGERLFLRVRFENVDFPNGIRIVSAVGETETDRLTVDSVVQGVCLDMGVIPVGGDNYYTMQGIVFAVTVLLVVFVFIALFHDRLSWKLEHIYLVVGPVLGIIYSLLIAVMAVPDEPVHIYKAYELSNTLMGIEESPDGALVMRQSDAEMAFRTTDLTRSYYNEYYDGIFSGAENKALVATGNIPVKAELYLYILPAVGITIGRLLGLSTVMMFMLGRLFNTLLFTLAVYYAIKKIPFGKAVIFVWATLPIMLQQMNSFSRDCPIYAMCILITAITLDFMFGGEKGRSFGAEHVILIICCVLLLPCKSFAYFPAVMLPLMLVPRRIEKHKARIKALRVKMKPWVKALLIALLAVLVAGMALAAVAVARRLTSPENLNNHYVGWSNQNGYTIGYFIQNPFALISMLFNTLWIKGDLYLTQMLGGSLGWLDISIPFVLVAPYMILLLIAAFRKENESQPITVGNKIWMWFVFLGVCGTAVIGMLLAWTPVGFNYVEGVQGRYFLPMLAAPIIGLRTKKACVGENADKIVVFAAVFLQIFIETAIFKNIV